MCRYSAFCVVTQCYAHFTDKETSLIELLEVILEWWQQAQALWLEPVDLCTVLPLMVRVLNNLHVVFILNMPNPQVNLHFPTLKQNQTRQTFD